MLALDAGRRWPAIFWLMVTGLLGLAFLALEISDFRDLIARGLAPQASGFLSAVFVLIGTHGLHVAMGILWIAILAVQLMIQGDDPQTRSRLLRLGYYWHFLDIVWIGIYSVVILPGSSHDARPTDTVAARSSHRLRARGCPDRHPFAVAVSGILSSRAAYAVISVCALVQVLVHLRYLFRLDRMAAARESLAVLAFAAVLILIMVSGSLWIMFDLHHRMMPPATVVLP